MAEKISVVIPCYNRSDYVEEALKSVWNQTCKPFEVIVVDDGSTEMFPFHLLRHPLKYYRINHSGVSVASNFGFAHTTGGCVIFLGADDKLHPNYISETLAAMRLKGKDIVYTATQEFGESHRTRWCFKIRSRFSLYRGAGGQLGAALIKSEVFNAVGGFDETLNGYVDWDFTIRAARKGFRVYGLNKPLHYWRKHPRQITSQSKVHYEALKRKHKYLTLFRAWERLLDFASLTFTHPATAFKRLRRKLR